MTEAKQRKKNKQVKTHSLKAQINMFETIAVLIVFMFLLGVGLVIYARIHSSSLEKDITQLRNLKATRIAETAFFLSELDCTFRGIRPPGSCLEKLKINAMSEQNKNKAKEIAYYDMFGKSRIEIQEVFPDNTYQAVIYDKSERDTGQIKSRTPVLLLDVLKGPTAYAFGIMEVTTST